MKEEDFIRKKCGGGNPFKTPEGYFEQFTANLMDKLPEKEGTPFRQPARFAWRKAAWYAAAATVCGAMFLGAFQLRSVRHAHQQITPVTALATESENLDDAYINDALDYAMVSNEEIVLYLTDTY